MVQGICAIRIWMAMLREGLVFEKFSHMDLEQEGHRSGQSTLSSNKVTLSYSCCREYAKTIFNSGFGIDLAQAGTGQPDCARPAALFTSLFDPGGLWWVFRETLDDGLPEGRLKPDRLFVV